MLFYQRHLHQGSVLSRILSVKDNVQSKGHFLLRIMFYQEQCFMNNAVLSGASTSRKCLIKDIVYQGQASTKDFVFCQGQCSINTKFSFKDCVYQDNVLSRKVLIKENVLSMAMFYQVQYPIKNSVTSMIMLYQGQSSIKDNVL